MSTILITGAGRGIGYVLAKQLLQQPASQVALVLVTARGPSTLLDSLVAASAGRLLRFHCEATNEQSVQSFAAELDAKLAGKGIDILVNSVGVHLHRLPCVMPMTDGGMCALDGKELMNTFDVNVVSAHYMTVAMIPLLQKGRGKKIIMVSTPLGSIGYASRYTWLKTPAYKVTKAAMNMMTAQYALDLGPQGFTVVAVSPGWLQTDMGSKDADLDVDTGVDALKNLILSAKEDANGKFFNIHVPGWEDAKGANKYDSAEIAW